MNMLLIFPGFILAFIVVILYECKIRNLSKKPMNKVHFYVARDKDERLWLYIGKPFRGDINFCPNSDKRVFVLTNNLRYYGLKYEDYDYLKWEDEPVEVFVNMEDRVMTLQEKNNLED